MLFAILINFLATISASSRTYRPIFEFILAGRSAGHDLRIHSAVLKFHTLPSIPCRILKDEVKRRYTMFQLVHKILSSKNLLGKVFEESMMPIPSSQQMNSLNRKPNQSNQTSDIDFDFGVYEWNQLILTSLQVSPKILDLLENDGHLWLSLSIDHRVLLMESIICQLKTKGDLVFCLHVCEYIRHLLVLQFEKSVKEGLWRRTECVWEYLLKCFSIFEY